MAELPALLDEISSTRSSTTRKNAALVAIEQHLAVLCVKQELSNQLDTFISSQDSFETNVASRIIAAISTWIPEYKSHVSQASDSKLADKDGGMSGLAQSIIFSMSILQGVALLHAPSKAFLGRRWCLELLLDLLNLSRHIPQSNEASNKDTFSEEALLAATVLDTLLCVLVDTPDAVRHFEEVGGLGILVRTLKKSKVSRDVRMKCLEFLYFYLLPEDENMPEAFDITASGSTQEIVNQQPSKAGTRPAIHLVTSPSEPSSDIEDERPIMSRSQHQMLRKEMDFTPATPTKKAQIAGLGLGSPHKRQPYSPSKLSRGVESASDSDRLASRRLVPSRWQEKDPLHVRTRSEVATSGLRRGSQDPVDLTERNVSTPTSRKTNLREPSDSGHSDDTTAFTPRKRHMRGTSATESTLVGNPLSGLHEDLIWSNSSELSELLKSRPKESSRLRSTSEKISLLGNHLGNVGALVEGLKKAGAWGLV
ncbi:hypothetical protein CPB86DRAFT_628815 [Serendipita vermifera]|nr:hypothetical protein CPB86DRAFT_628815 [Serendipita vermifera]